MSILIDRNTRVLVQGITGKVGSFQTQMMLENGTQIVAGVTPGKGGTTVCGVPVYDFVRDAIASEPIDAVISFVPARFVRDAALEAIEGGIPLLVLTAADLPVHDIMAILNSARAHGARVLGPDTPGLVAPGHCKLGVHPDRVLREGSIGVVSKSGALSYEVCKQLTEGGFGQSAVVGIGGGPLWDLDHPDILQLFEEDPLTKAIVLLGEVGGTMEHDAAVVIQERISKPVIALIVGRSAPEGTRMGHAGAIVGGQQETADSKIQALREAGAHIARTPADIVRILRGVE